MKTHFDIGEFSEGWLKAQQVICELGETYCSLAGLNADNIVTAWRIYTFQKTELEGSLRQIEADIFSGEKEFEKVFICSALPYSVLVPAPLFAAEQNYLLSVYDNKQLPQLHDTITEWQMVNVYALPQTVLKKFGEEHDNVVFSHIYTCGIKSLNIVNRPNLLEVHFISSYFRVLVVREGQFILAQTYCYTTPIDVIYYLLKIGKEFNIAQESVAVVLCGFIDEDSALFNEIFNYFTDVSFKPSNITTVTENNYPQHFFTSINNLLACV